MMELTGKKHFEWDDGNRAKCQKHGISIAEIEEVLLGEPLFAPDMKHSADEQRFLAIGRTQAGRAAYVVFVLRGDAIRPLSARYMRAKEARKYEESP